MTIKWNAERNGVEVQTNDEHFVIDATPSRVMSWRDAVRFYQNAGGWTLPTKKQLQLVAKHISEVNALLEQYGGYKLFGWHWSSEEADTFCAWIVFIDNDSTCDYFKGYDGYVRAVSVLSKKQV